MRLTRTSLENAALHYLGRYAATRKSLEQVLKKKVRRAGKESPEAMDAALALIPPLVERYVESGLINDAVFAEARAASLHRKGKSSRLIAQNLSEKGVEKELVRETVKAWSSDEQELEAARELCRRKKLGVFRTKVDTDPKRKQKDIAHLARAGFRYALIVRALAGEVARAG
jgi:regulatory protein